MEFFAALLDQRIAIVEAPLIGEPEELVKDLQGDEVQSVARAVPKRRREFAIGRACARQAMVALGHDSLPLPPGPDRMPLWPHDLVGSITHTDAWAAAAVARRNDGFAAVGIDLEPASELEVDLWAAICSPAEQEQLSGIAGMTPGLAAHVLFGMKEAAFKCQFPLSRAMLEFADFAIDIDARTRTFSATFCRDVAPFHAGHRLAGRFAITGGHIASAVVLTLEQEP